MDMNIKTRLDFAQAPTPTLSCFCHFSIIKGWIWQSSSLPKAFPFMLLRLPTGPVSNLSKKRFLLFQHRINFFFYVWLFDVIGLALPELKNIFPTVTFQHLLEKFHADPSNLSPFRNKNEYFTQAMLTLPSHFICHAQKKRQ